MQPDPGLVRAAIDALRSDALIWEESSSEVRAAAGVAGVLDLSALQFSTLCDQIGMTELYRDVQDRMVRLLSQAADVHADMASRLRLTADGYENAEEAAERATRGVY
jgi:hypothetical protein